MNKHWLRRVKIDRQAKQPLHQQVLDALTSWLDLPEVKAGDQLPTEAELCRWFRVARGTVRRALDTLVKEGLIRRKQGAGSVVVRPRLRLQLSRYLSFTESCRQRGIVPSSRVVRLGVRKASTPVAAALGVPPGDRVIELERVRYADGTAICLDAVLISEARFPTFRQHDFASESLFEVLAGEPGIVLSRARGSLRPMLAGKREARLLQARPYSAMLLVETVVSTQDGSPVLLSREMWRGDRTQYLLEQEPPAAT